MRYYQRLLSRFTGDFRGVSSPGSDQVLCQDGWNMLPPL